MSAQIQTLQKQVEQLRQEASIQRITVSQAIEEMISFTNTHAEKDGLVVGVPQADNPFRDQKGCIIL